ncbi:MAG: heavy metal translocating P-type ATPase, partial [Armatimonadaceae bacterium]
SGAALERLAHVDAVAFDKTGTLTVGTPALVEVVAIGPVERMSVLHAAATVESRSGHVLARATVAAARDEGMAIGSPDAWSEHPGSGLSGRAAGTDWHIGSETYLLSKDVLVDDGHRRRHAEVSQDGRTVAWVASGKQVVGFLAYADTLRPESPAMAARLRRLGVRRIVLITGDTAAAAKAVANAIGADECHARTQPEDKQDHLIRLKESGYVVLMVGDGINDAPALASAPVSVAMGDHGAGIATDTADVVITVENVERVADAIAIGQRMVRVATQGIVFGMGVSSVLMLVAALGWIRPALGAGLQELLDLLALLNALRVRRRAD